MSGAQTGSCVLAERGSRGQYDEGQYDERETSQARWCTATRTRMLR